MFRKKEVKLALGNWIVCIGIFFASISVFNLFSDNFILLLSPLVSWFVSVYQLFFHTPLEATGIHLSENVKNIMSVYFLIGGISSRAIFPNTNWIVSFLAKNEIVHNTRLREISLIKKPFAKSKILTLIYCLFLWPVVFYRIYQTPKYLVTPGVMYKDRKGKFKPVYELYSANKKISDGEDGFDARNILIIQLTVMVCVFILLLIVNYFSY